VGVLPVIAGFLSRPELVHPGGAVRAGRWEMPVPGADDTGVFISYRREDASWPARWLADRLTARFGPGVVFQDVESIGPGDDFAAEIEAAVAACSVLLAVMGPRWLGVEEGGGRRLDDPDDWVRLEVEAAISRGVRVIPVLVDGARMPSAGELPPSLSSITRRQAVVLDPVRLDIRRLVSVLERALASGGSGDGQAHRDARLASPYAQVAAGVNPEAAGAAHDPDGLYLRVVEQLGNGREAVRVGAMHALSRLGQANPGLRRTIMDVICAYLRMSDGRPAENPAADPAVQASWRKELQVRQTAQRIIADHLRDEPPRGQRGDSPAPEAFWPEIDLIDLRGAYLEDLNLSGCRISVIEFNATTFAGETLFRALRCDLAFFQKALFKGFADFRGAAFTQDAWFSWAAFDSDVWFHGDEFYPPAHFGRHVSFREVTFAGKARFEKALFGGSADFEAITCTTGTGAINLNGGQVSRPGAVNPDVSQKPSAWPSGWHLRPLRDGTATLKPGEHPFTRQHQANHVSPASKPSPAEESHSAGRTVPGGAGAAGNASRASPRIDSAAPAGSPPSPLPASARMEPREGDLASLCRIGLLGPSGVGKTSLVAALLSESQNVLDGTGMTIRPADLITEHRLAECRMGLESTVSDRVFRPGGVQGTMEPFTFRLMLDPGVPNSETNIELLDFPGGWLDPWTRPEAFSDEWETCRAFITQSTILVIPVDAALLMEAVEVTHSRAVSRLLSIPDVELVARDWAVERNRRRHEPALVAFCPVKCESYFVDNGGWRDKSAVLSRKFLQVYATVIKVIRDNAPLTKILYTPIDTIGCVELLESAWPVEAGRDQVWFSAEYRIRVPQHISRVGVADLIRAVAFQLVDRRRRLEAERADLLAESALRARAHAEEGKGLLLGLGMLFTTERSGRLRTADTRSEEAREASHRVSALQAVLEQTASFTLGPRVQIL
jgi:TIR domain